MAPDIFLFQTELSLRKSKGLCCLTGSDLLKSLTSSLPISSGFQAFAKVMDTSWLPDADAVGYGGRQAVAPQGMGNGPVYPQALHASRPRDGCATEARYFLNERRPHSTDLKEQNVPWNFPDPLEASSGASIQKRSSSLRGNFVNKEVKMHLNEKLRIRSGLDEGKK